jgi:DTW domain-containing protein YfiP
MKTSIIILRHPDERKKTLSTVSLIKQRYPDVLVKEARIFHPMRTPSMALLFPIINSQANQQQYSPSQHKANDHNKLATRAQTLVLLDATWPKAKRILHENSWIADLPRISIKPKSPSGYLLRKVPNANALSTVEVFAHIQNDELLQDHFRWFIKKQIERIGIEKYRRNYRHHINYTPKKP